MKEYEDKLKPKERVRIVEDDFLMGDVIEFPNDIYNLTIAANMTHDCSPMEVTFAIR